MPRAGHLNLGFETGTLADWTAEGDAFKGQPIKGDSVQMRGRGKSGNDGKFWVGTFEESVVTSPRED